MNDSEEPKERSLALPKVSAEMLPHMIQSDHPLSERGLRVAAALSRLFQLPPSGLTFFSDRDGKLHVFVNFTGVLWRLHADPRGVQRIRHRVLHEPTEEEPFVRVEAEVVMGDGSVYTNEAWLTLQVKDGQWYELTRRGLWAPVNLGDRIMACITKAIRRAALLAVGIGLPILEDAMILQEHEGSADRPQAPASFAELLQWAKGMGWSPTELAEAVGRDLQEIAHDPVGAWQALQAKGLGQGRRGPMIQETGGEA